MADIDLDSDGEKKVVSITGGDVPEAQSNTTTNEDGSVNLKLAYPLRLTFSGGPQGEREEETSVLTFRRLNGGDLMAIDRCKKDQEMAQARMLFMRSTGLAQAAFDKLDAFDVGEGLKVIEGFLPKHLKTGKTS